jgi:outer membrane protein assembly factor BamB
MIRPAHLGPLRCRGVRRLVVATIVASLVLPATGAGGGLLRFRDFVSSPSVTLAPADGPPASNVTVVLKGFGTGEPIDVFFDDTSVGVAKGGGAGDSTEALITVPASATPGVHWVTAKGEWTQLVAQAPFRVHIDWPSWRNGPEHTGFNPFETVLSRSNVAGLELDWSYSTGDGTGIHGSPSVVDGVVYVGSDSNYVYALDASSGALRWKSATPPKYNLHVWSSPAVANGIVYIGTSDYGSSGGGVYAFTADGGRPLWSALTGGATVESSPAVANGVVYVGTNDGKLHALNAASGAPLWSATIGGGRSSPAVVNGVVYIGGGTNLYALDAASGAPLWTAPAGCDRYEAVISSPAVVNGVVYVGGCDALMDAFDAASGALLWKTGIGEPTGSSPAVANGVVYVGSNDDPRVSVRHLYALDAASGAVLWSKQTPINWSSPVVANGVVYVLLRSRLLRDKYVSSRLYAFSARSGARLWKATTGGLGGSSPTVVDGRVYISTGDGDLNAYHLPAP